MRWCWNVHFLMVYFSSGWGNKIDCGREYDVQKWDCDNYAYFFHPLRVEQTLYCLDYNAKISPKKQEQPVQYHLGATFKDLLKIDETEMELLFIAEIIADNPDHRLKFNCTNNFNYKPNIFWNPLWTPNSMGFQEIRDYSSIDPITLNATQGTRHYFDTGRIRQYCKFNYYWFPFDEQFCDGHLEVEDSNDIQVIPIHLSETQSETAEWVFTVSTRDLYQNHQGTRGHGIDIEFRLERKSLRNLITIYLPSILLSITSALSLYIPKELTPARMSLSITTFLALVTHFRGAAASWPRIAAIRMIDVWVTLCYFNGFFCMVEYCLVLALCKGYHLSQIRPSRMILEDNLEDKKNAKLVAKIESLSRVAVPLYIVVTSIIYFSFCGMHVYHSKEF